MLRQRHATTAGIGSASQNAAASSSSSANAPPVKLGAKPQESSSSQPRDEGEKRKMEPPSERQPLLDGEDTSTDVPSTTWNRNQWILLAVASGACAAFNGAFAKL
jgi:hypothetical protein